jgi:hypothetical protein
MNNKPKYFLTKALNFDSKCPEYQIIYPDHINIEGIYQLVKSKYNIPRVRIDYLCRVNCNRDPYMTGSDLHTNAKLIELSSNTYSLGGKTTNNSLNPTDSVLSQTGDCVVLAPVVIHNNVKIRDNAIVGCYGSYNGKIIIKDNAVVLNTELHGAEAPTYNNIRIQGNSIILNSGILFPGFTSELPTIDIQDYTYCDNVIISIYSMDNKMYSIILSGYTYLENVRMSFCAACENQFKIYNTQIKSDHTLKFYMNAPVNLIGISLDMNKISKEEQLSFFEKHNIKDKEIIRNSNIVKDCNGHYVLLDDVINAFAD